MMTGSFDRGLARFERFVPPTAAVKKSMETSSDFLSGVKKQLRQDYREALEISLPQELATLIEQLDKAP